MSKCDGMINYQKEVSALKVKQLKKAVKQMIKEGYKITPYTVYKYTGFSKPFIYQNKKAFDFIQANRNKGGTKRVPYHMMKKNEF